MREYGDSRRAVKHKSHKLKMGVKKYFKNEFQLSNFGLEHDIAPDFYLGSWQNNRSCVPLLCLRGILCAGNIAIVIASFILTTQMIGSFGYWWIYLTHWGILINAVTTAFAFGISVKVHLGGPLDSAFGLPWYIKMYWFLFNASVPVAFLITIFYWGFISDQVDWAKMNYVLDVFIHAINSVMMLALLVTSRHPSRLLHFHHAVAFGLVYLAFNVIYYLAGGLDPNGHVWIYPMLDWSNPGNSIIVVVGVAIGLIILHWLVVLMVSCRNYFSWRIRKDNRSFSVSE